MNYLHVQGVVTHKYNLIINDMELNKEEIIHEEGECDYCGLQFPHMHPKNTLPKHFEHFVVPDCESEQETPKAPCEKHEWRACTWSYDYHQNGDGIAWKFVTKVFCIHCLTTVDLVTT